MDDLVYKPEITDSSMTNSQHWLLLTMKGDLSIILTELLVIRCLKLTAGVAGKQD